MVPKGDVDYMLEEREIKLEHKLQDQETLAQSPTTPVSSNTPTVFVPPDNDSNNARDLEAALAAQTTTSMPRARPSFSRPMLAPPTTALTEAGGPSYQSHPRRPPHFPVSPVSPLSSVSPVSPLSPTDVSAATTTLPVEAGFILSSTEMHANLAMITDGSRYSPQQINNNNNNNSQNQLPPYSPGNHRRMNGHGDESNEIRLSEYVKGATRAQEMKDGGGY
jgi:hypothetical protein